MALMGQYEYVIDATHPRANSEGQVYVHIIVAEEKLGRRLLVDETVHHRDLNKLNNHPENLLIFATKSDHTRFHVFNCDESFLELTPNGSYICKAKTHVCMDCGIAISKGAQRCVQCDLIHKRLNRPHSRTITRFVNKNQR